MTFNRFFVVFVLAFFPTVAAFSQPAQPNSATSKASASDIDPPQRSGRVFVSTPARDTHRLVSDCMTPRSEMSVLHPDVSADDAISLLLKRGISGAPVVDPKTGKLKGIISSSDFIFKDYSGALLNMEGSSESLARNVEVAKKIVGSTVEELMSHKVMTIKSTEPMAKAADWMARNNLHRLLVVNPEDEDDLVGILTRSDVMRDVMTTVRLALPEHADDDDEAATRFQP